MGATVKLAAREAELLSLIAQAYDNEAIASEMQLSNISVRVRLNALYNKLSLDNQPYSVNKRVAAARIYWELKNYATSI